jgi:hypothetical protein
MKNLTLPIVLLISISAGLIVLSCGKSCVPPARYSPPQYGPNDTAPACADTPHAAGTNPCDPNYPSDTSFMQADTATPYPLPLQPADPNDSLNMLRQAAEYDERHEAR